MIATWDTFINSNSATSSFGGTATCAIGILASNRRHIYMGFPVTLRFEDVDWSDYFSTAPTGTFNFVALPVVEQLAIISDGSGISWNHVNESLSTNWTTPPQLTTGPGSSPGGGVDNNVRAVFEVNSTVIPSGGRYHFSDTPGAGIITPLSGKLYDVFNRAKGAAIAQGVANAVICICHENETSGSGAITFHLLESTSPDSEPTLSGTGVNVVYGFLLEAAPGLCNQSQSEIDVRLQISDYPFTTGDELSVEFSDDANDFPDDAAATGGTEATAYEFDGSETPGDPFLIELDDTDYRTADYCYQYRVKATVAGLTYYAPVHRAPLHLPPGMKTRFGRYADDHGKSFDLERYGFDIIPLDASGPETLQIFTAIWNRMKAYADLAEDFLRFLICKGDCMDYGQYTNEFAPTMFPVIPDGLGIPSPDAVRSYVQSTGDAKETYRSYFIWFGGPTESVPIKLVPGNHMPFHWHFFATNNGGVNDAAGWMLSWAKAFGLIPPSDGYHGYDSPEYEHGTIGDYSFKCGDTRFFVMNNGYDSETTLTANQLAGIDPLPGTLADPDEWVYRQDRRDWRNALVALKDAKFLSDNIHSGMGGEPSQGPQANYDFTDEDSVFNGEWENHMQDSSEQYYSDASEKVCGHDHIHHILAKRRGTRNIYCGRPVDSKASPTQGGPYGFGNIAGNQLHGGNENPAIRWNGGWYLCEHTSKRMRTQYISGVIHTSPIDYADEAAITGGWSSKVPGIVGKFAEGEVVQTVDVAPETGAETSPLHPGHPFSLIRRRRLLHG